MTGKMCKDDQLCVGPFSWDGATPEDGSWYYLKVKEQERAALLFQYDMFLEQLKSAEAVAFQVEPMIYGAMADFFNYATQRNVNGENIALDPVWIRFSLEGAKTAISKLGQELN